MPHAFFFAPEKTAHHPASFCTSFLLSKRSALAVQDALLLVSVKGLQQSPWAVHDGAGRHSQGDWSTSQSPESSSNCAAASGHSLAPGSGSHSPATSNHGSKETGHRKSIICKCNSETTLGAGIKECWILTKYDHITIFYFLLYLCFLYSAISTCTQNNSRMHLKKWFRVQKDQPEL